MRMLLKIMTAESVRRKSCGEVTEVNAYKGSVPRVGGLSCLRIFGATVSYKCGCGALEGVHYLGNICDHCGVEIAHNSVRRKRWGHINLPIHVLQPILLEPLARALKLSPAALKKIAVGKARFSLVDGPIPTSIGGIRIVLDREGEGTGPVDLRSLLEKVEWENLESQITPDIAKCLFTNCVGVLPADLRPDSTPNNDAIELDAITHKYVSVLNVTRAYTSLHRVAPFVPKILKELAFGRIQEAVLNLVLGRGTSVAQEDPGLLDLLTGKSGMLRKTALGKRVDFSGRTVLGGAPTSAVDLMQLPRHMGRELFKPFILRELVGQQGFSYRESLQLWKADAQEARVALESVATYRRVFVNRNPSLHKASVVGLRVEITEDLCMHLPHYVYAGLAADADGDTLAIHVPMSEEAMQETQTLLAPEYNLRTQAAKDPAYVPSHESLGGLYHATSIQGKPGPSVYRSIGELEILLDAGKIKSNTAITWKEIGKSAVTTTLGRLTIAEMCGPKVTCVLDKQSVKEYVDLMVESLDPKQVLIGLQKLQDYGYAVVTKAGVSIALQDLKPPASREEVFSKARIAAEGASVDELHSIWEEAIAKVYASWQAEGGDDPSHPAHFFNIAAGRLSDIQVRQLMVAKGLQANYKEELLNFVIEGCLSEGLSIPDYLRSMSGSRASHIAKIDATPKSGYIARKLVHIGRDLYITGFDCGTTNTLDVKEGYGRYDSCGIQITTHGKASVRSPIFCEEGQGVCIKCYGAIGKLHLLPVLHEPVGICAGQSFSERATQKSLQKKHSGGAAGAESGINAMDHAVELQVKYKHLKLGEWCDNAKELYSVFSAIVGTSVASQHSETLVLGMSALSLQGDEYVYWEKFPEGRQLLGATSLMRRHPSWLRSIGFGYVKEKLISTVLQGKTTQEVPGEYIFTGLLDVVRVE